MKTITGFLPMSMTYKSLLFFLLQNTFVIAYCVAVAERNALDHPLGDYFWDFFVVVVNSKKNVYNNRVDEPLHAIYRKYSN